METRKMLPFLAAVALVIGCDSSTGTQMGRIEAFAADAPAEPAPAPTADQAPARESDSFSGSFTGSAQVSISADGATWVDLAPPSTVVIAMQSGNAVTLHGTVECPVGPYARVRVRFRNAQAVLAAGSIIGGVTFTSGAVVMLGGSDQEVVIEKSVTPFTVRADATTRVYFNLNAAAWINSQSVQAQSVADATIQQAVAASVAS